MTMKRNDVSSKRRRQEKALANFSIDPTRAKVDKDYQARKDMELRILKAKLGKGE